MELGERGTTCMRRLKILSIVCIACLGTFYGVPKLLEIWLLSHLNCWTVVFVGDLLGCAVHARYVGWRFAGLLYWLLTTAELLLSGNQVLTCRDLIPVLDAVPAILLTTRAVRAVVIA